MRVATPLVLTFSLGACATSLEREPEAEAQPVDLSGEWILNEALSDSPREVLGTDATQNAAAGAARQVGGSFGVFGVSVSDIINMLPRRGTDEPPEYHSHVTDARNALVIEQDETWVEVTYDQAGIAYYPNGGTTYDQLDEIFSDWDGATYVVTRTPDDGPVLTESFELGPDGKQLIWSVTFETDNGKEIVITRIYDAANTEEDSEDRTS